MEDKPVNAVKQKHKSNYSKSDKQKQQRRLKNNLVVNADMSMENCNAPRTENAVPGVNVSITFRKCVKLHFRPVQNQRKNMSMS